MGTVYCRSAYNVVHGFVNFDLCQTLLEIQRRNIVLERFVCWSWKVATFLGRDILFRCKPADLNRGMTRVCCK